MEQDQLKHELVEMTMRVSNKDAGIAFIKAELLKAQIEGPDTEEVKELKKQNEELFAKIVALQEKMILSKISQLVMEQNQLKHELEEMTMRVTNKDAEIALLKAELLKAQTEGPGTEEVKELKKQNEELLAKIAALQEKMIRDNDAANSRLTLVINSLSHKPLSS
ncbi:hypothetical protein KY290_019506 [Solanum tuberosum]|uniref:Uncharacterized protein n=1 Tax=Solanum tuberosum TaxID=4113 RepID=A0ABQ7VJC7_SOLTU|nr:hypothetical protein KY284_018402 [Solanum tuberosum]KAH0691224.1 hypothetical protein KY289_018582 [Solanum tuberosum]KAH0704139.1 hypothetical protein KY285_018417 [Solanum tuberosum]KAH0763433.1 hypothetical protein KY290_019506 [Solanum tuberosum]